MAENKKMKSTPVMIFSIAFPVIEYWIINNLVYFFLRTTLFDNDAYNMQISAAAMAFAGFWFFQRYRLEEKDTANVKEKIKWHSFLIFSVFAITFSLWINLLVLKLDLARISQSYMQTSAMQYSVSLWFGILLYGVISPLAEELVFRGILQNRIKRAMNKTTAIVLSSFLFGLYHGNLLQGMYAFVIAIFFALVYEKYNRIALPVIFHSLINVTSFLLTYFGWMQKLTSSILILIVLSIINIVLIVYMRFEYQKKNVVEAAGREEL